ncbi:MAG: ORF6N domain-containing protein [Pseudomonadota bacterium]
MKQTDLIIPGFIEKKIYFIREHRVILDSDLAELYEVSVKILNQAIKRNKSRFPADFMFQLTKEEDQSLRSQFVTLNTGRGQHRKYLPYAFTEQGVAMLSSVLKSKRAIQVNIEIMRTFVKLRELISSHRGLAQKLNALEKHYNYKFKIVFDAIHELMTPPTPKRRRIGFKVDDKK